MGLSSRQVSLWADRQWSYYGSWLLWEAPWELTSKTLSPTSVCVGRGTSVRGDTPSVLYVIDADHDLDDPTEGSWAGRYHKPFPDERPQYWTGIDGAAAWNYAEPRLTWANRSVVFAARKQTLLDRRPAMYVAFLEKVRRLYGAN